MKTLAKHMNELGWDFDEDERARRLFEARDREIRAAALREAANAFLKFPPGNVMLCDAVVAILDSMAERGK